MSEIDELIQEAMSEAGKYAVGSGTSERVAEDRFAVKLPQPMPPTTLKERLENMGFEEVECKSKWDGSHRFVFEYEP